MFFRDHSALTGDRRDHVIAAREWYESYRWQELARGVEAKVEYLDTSLRGIRRTSN